MSGLARSLDVSARTVLHECGEALYGPRWQSDLARALDVSDRTVRRWAKGQYPVPAGVWLDLLRLSQERAEQLDAIAGRLRAAGATSHPHRHDTIPHLPRQSHGHT